MVMPIGVSSAGTDAHEGSRWLAPTQLASAIPPVFWLRLKTTISSLFSEATYTNLPSGETVETLGREIGAAPQAGVVAARVAQPVGPATFVSAPVTRFRASAVTVSDW